ncbi:hypothetical protein K493DRAFT_362012 [Basidiobolus meristosporus CBS 931.73]|uniref:Uncharacterized protein n=1 Tax=Basidiobolus meristosporus CBS 931.73 TaxID=1314790 RepID=A0A1Y1X6Q9_9FUNG|nr:hypothetical protein K493DRAFT_362012 [Basidiobolus meristosporus CBS 931.73]|eukprot:ORX80994.1 hypothetical protein K493DRAFT_362012 [Basidiobolus meristosporus CBS 931.73]
MKFFSVRSLSIVFVLSSATTTTTTAMVIKRDKVPYAAKENYCSGLVARLNYFGARLDARVCIGEEGKVPSPYGGRNPHDLTCGEAAISAIAFGIDVNADLCSGDSKPDPCSAIVAKLAVLGVTANINVCLQHIQNGGLPNLSGGNSCPNIVADANLLGLNVNAQICLGRGDTDHREQTTCPDILAKLNILGLKLDASICLNNLVTENLARLSGGNSCPDIVADANLLGINVNPRICLRADSAENSNGKTCPEVLAKLDLLGIKIDAAICPVGTNLPLLSGGRSCPDVVADANLLGIKVSASICLHEQNGNSAPGCPNIVASLVNSGIDANAFVCLANGEVRSSAPGLHLPNLNLQENNAVCNNIRLRLDALGIRVRAVVCLPVVEIRA